MPIVTIYAFEGRTVEQRRELAQAITEAIVRIYQTPKEAVHIIFRDMKRQDYATAGKLASD